MNYNICVALRVKSASLSEIKPLLDKGIKKKPNFIEFRFDYIDNVQSLSLDFVKDLLNIINHRIPVIFTFRDSSEGGQSNITQEEHFKILKMFIEAKPEYIDIEMSTEEIFLYDFITLASQNGINLICSYHNFEKTDNLEDTINLISNFNDKLVQNASLISDTDSKIIIKVISTAQTFKDNIIPLKLCKHFTNFPRKLISFCMGETGIFSRIMCVTVGSFFTYATIEEKTAPGQLPIDQMREIYNLFPNSL
ncbi:MAG: type I 3-dehydroquinate dehydratase [Candidatus Odinarchaeota archaeon]